MATLVLIKLASCHFTYCFSGFFFLGKSYTVYKIYQTFMIENETLIECNHPFLHSNYIEFLQFCEKTNYLPVNTYKTFPNVRGIIVENKNLQKVDAKSFEGLLKLEIIQLNGNNLTHVPEDTFKNLGKLRIIILRNNKIATLNSNIFKFNTNLVWIAVDAEIVLDWNTKLLAAQANYDVHQNVVQTSYFIIAVLTYCVIDLTIALSIVCYRMRISLAE